MQLFSHRCLSWPPPKTSSKNHWYYFPRRPNVPLYWFPAKIATPCGISEDSYFTLFIRSCSIAFVWIDKRVRSSKLGSVLMTGGFWLSASEGFNLHRVRKANLASCIFAVETWNFSEDIICRSHILSLCLFTALGSFPHESAWRDGKRHPATGPHASLSQYIPLICRIAWADRDSLGPAKPYSISLSTFPRLWSAYRMSISPYYLSRKSTSSTAIWTSD